MDRPSRCVAIAPWTMIWGVTAPNPHAPRATANRPTPLQAGARSTHRGLRVRVVDSFEESFVWGSWIELSCPSSIGCLRQLGH